MRIRSLKIKNFRAHESSYIEFNDGINLIIGQNGSGKSSILEAIFAALYLGHGSFPRGYKRVNTRIGKSGFELVLKFEHNDKRYEIVRKSNAESYLKEHGAILYDRDSDIAKWSEKHLYPLHVFRNALYIKQGEIENILIDENVREKVLRKVLGIEDFENSANNAQEVVRELRRKKDYLEKLIQTSGDLQGRIEEQEKKLKEILVRINELRKQEIEISEKLSGVSRRYEYLKKLSELLGQKEKEKLSTEGSLKQLETEIKNIKERISELEKELNELGDKEKRLIEIQWVEEEYRMLNAILSKRAEIQKIEIEESRLEERIRGIQREISELSSKEKEFQEAKKLEKEVLERYRTLKGFAEEYEKVRQLLAEREKYLKELEKAGYTKEKLTKELEEVEKAKEKLKELEDRLVSLKGELNGLNRIEWKLRDNLSKLEGAKECPLCKRPIQEHDKGEIEREYKLEFAKIEEKKKEISKQLKELKEEKEKLERIKNREKTLIKLYKTLEFLETVEKKLKRYDIERLKTSSEEFEKVREKAIEIKKEIIRLKRETERLVKVKKELETISKDLENLKGRKRAILQEIRERGFTSFEEVEKRIRKLDPIYKEYIELRAVPKEIETRKKKQNLLKNALEKKEREFNILKENLKVIYRELEELNRQFSEEEFEAIRKEHLNLSNTHAALLKEIEGSEVLKEEVLKNLEELKIRLEEVKKAEKELELVGRMIADMKTLREKLLKLKAEAERKGLSEVERVASELFSEMTERKYQGIKIIREKKFGKERIRIVVLYQGQEKEIDFLSGGEKIALGLSFRLALSLYKVKNMELLILDEPTPFLDEERRKKLVEIITQHLRKIPQVIIVSHDEELKDAADYVIRVTLVGGRSNVEVESLGAY
ncbi:DNA double-strand break repair ATPase Rad50 [Thermococcus argininiproducens]|nr:DNA double-strand break repair ATPase Rad50 [Thermococcus argininiproducens]